MSLTHHPDHDDEELVRYVLGLLPDGDAERLDEASMTDDEVAARLRIAETNLIDRYVRGQLTGATLEQFESYYRSSPLRRENVRRAASFIRAVDRSVARAERADWQQRIGRQARLVRIAAAAALVVVVCGVILFQAVRPRNEVRLATAESGAVERPAAAVPPPAASEPAAASSSPLPGSPGVTRTAPPGAVVAVVLLPPTRAVVPIPVVAVPAGADRVRFELRLESNDFPDYRVVLKNPATQQILWRSEWMAPSTGADQASVPVVVPASLLAPQHYSLDLTGRGAGGRMEVIGSYTVRIARP